MLLRLLLTLCGGLEILAGLAALIIPATVVSLLLGGPGDSISSVVARLFGAGVFALGLACLKARNDAVSPAGLAVSLGITAYNVLAAVVLLWTAAGSSLGGLLLWGAGILHAALGALLFSFGSFCSRVHAVPSKVYGILFVRGCRSWLMAPFPVSHRPRGFQG